MEAGGQGRHSRPVGHGMTVKLSGLPGGKDGKGASSDKPAMRATGKMFKLPLRRGSGRSLHPGSVEKCTSSSASIAHLDRACSWMFHHEPSVWGGTMSTCTNAPVSIHLYFNYKNRSPNYLLKKRRRIFLCKKKIDNAVKRLRRIRGKYKENRRNRSLVK